MAEEIDMKLIGIKTVFMASRVCKSLRYVELASGGIMTAVRGFMTAHMIMIMMLQGRYTQGER